MESSHVPNWIRFLCLLWLILANTTFLNAQIIDTVCTWAGPSHLAVPATQGSSYYWEVNGGNIQSGQGTADILVNWVQMGAISNTFVIETNSSGCMGDTIWTQVYVADFNSTNISGPTEACEGELVKLFSIDTRKAGKYLWSTGDSTETIQFVAQRDTLVYRVALNEVCENDTVFHHLKVNPLPEILLQTDAVSDTLQLNTVVHFRNTGRYGSNVNWYLNGQLMTTGLEVDIQFLVPGRNTLEVSSSNGTCDEYFEYNFWVQDDIKVYIPNAFSPNRDRVNEAWNIQCVGITAFRVYIFDRWGTQLAFWSNESNTGWDGTYNGESMPEGSYHYRVETYDLYNMKEEYRGTILLVR